MPIMLSYFICLFYLSAISIADSDEMRSKYYEVKDTAQYYNYQVVNGETVELKVYYECLCPGCIQFHTGPLEDTYKKMGTYIDLKTYPYGNAEKSLENGQTVITCQHGPAECYGNKLHACATDVLKDVSRSELYNSCMMKCQWGGRGSTDMDATNCGRAMGIDSKPIIGCANSQRGEDLLEYYGRETDKVVNRTSVPWVLLNGKFFDTDMGDLMKAVCAALRNPPAICDQSF